MNRDTSYPDVKPAARAKSVILRIVLGALVGAVLGLVWELVRYDGGEVTTQSVAISALVFGAAGALVSVLGMSCRT
jgi:LytS/YehU family sensor histidine kinase